MGGKQNDTGEEILKGIIVQVRDLFERESKAMVQDAIKNDHSARNIINQGNPITKIDQLTKKWVDNFKLKENLRHCCYSVFAKEIDIGKLARK